MRYAIFSDIHSNLPAFNAVLEEYRKEKIDKYFCAGDIVGYAANPSECLELIKELNPVIVAGNHDYAAVDLTDIEYFNPLAKKAVIWTKSVLNEQEKGFLKGLPLVFEGKEFAMVHAALESPEEFEYLTNEYIAKRTFNLMKGNLLFVGHTHVAGIFIQENKKISYTDSEKIKLKPNLRYIVNAGSVGQPRDGNPGPSFCILDAESMILEIRRVAYDIELAQKGIIDAGLPSYLADRLLIGH